MLHSMTAFVRHAESLPWGTLDWEIRSLNYRHLEIDINVPSAFRHLESLFRDELRQLVYRGRITCSLAVNLEDASLGLHIDTELLAQVLAALKKIRQHDQSLAPASDLDLLKWPGMMVMQSVSDERQDEAVKSAFLAAIKAMIDKRGQEGGGLEAYLQLRFNEIQECLAEIGQCVKRTATIRRANLIESLQGLLHPADLPSERMEQEVALLVSKSDISEEMERLHVHLSDAREMVGRPGPHGRQLDFLMQEMNREANTMSAKVHQVEAGRVAIRLRTSIDQAREQIQNIE